MVALEIAQPVKFCKYDVNTLKFRKEISNYLIFLNVALIKTIIITRPADIK